MLFSGFKTSCRSSEEEDKTTLDYSHHECKNFQMEIIRDGIVSGVKDSDYFSCVFDESTDLSLSQNVIKYVRYLRFIFDRDEPTASCLAIRSFFRATEESITR